MSAPLWTPSKQQVESSQIYQFMQQINEQHDLKLEGYEQLHQWSVENIAFFWDSIWQTGEVIGDKGDTVVEGLDQMPGARWFPEAQLNFAENLLRYQDDQAALIFRNEQDTRICISYSELYQRVAQLASGMQNQGIKAGDVVAGFLPNIPDAVVAMLATTSLGATWTSCSPDFGINGVLERFGQVEPKLLFCCEHYFYNGKEINCSDKIDTIITKLKGLEHREQVISIPYPSNEPADTSSKADLTNRVTLEAFIDHKATEIAFVQQTFSSPLYIMYSSGTTGVPKCIVHGIGGTLLQHLKEHRLHTDLNRDDTLFYFTTCGWMMWNWLVSGLASGATLVLYDGSPFSPSAQHLWDITEEEGITVFGTSAKYISAIEKADVRPLHSHQLPKLRAVLSTGSPLSQESFEYVYRDVKSDLILASISGGTDIISCFALGCPIKPVYAGELQCLGLGMQVDIYDDAGNAIRNEKGELVCSAPFPSMPTGFWNDEQGSKFHDAYFARFDNCWAHGDYGEITEHNGMIIHGRSDAVLNPGGVRIGTAEIYRQVEKVDTVLDAICIGQPWKDDTRVVLFVVLEPEEVITEELIHDIKTTIRTHTSPRHVPEVIIQVAEIPRTISGKIVELAVRNVVMGLPVKNQDALANPEALAFFANLPELLPELEE